MTQMVSFVGKGDISIEEGFMCEAVPIEMPRTVKMNRLSVDPCVDRLMFADGTTFVRESIVAKFKTRQGYELSEVTS